MSTVRLNTAAGYGPPPPQPTITPAYVQLWVPRSVLPTILTILEPSMWAFGCHYWQRRTRACVGAAAGCEACPAGQSRRLTAWIAAMIRDTRQRVLLQLTAGALAGCPELVIQDGKLTGKIVAVRRRHDGKQSPVDVQIHALRDTAIPVIPPSTPKVLAAVWGYTESQLSTLRCPAYPPALDSGLDLVDNTHQ